mmetsp:Transcript_1323/g.2733  ORF Transcript_1323/g.2733 Transcript_1323/m.2733 type:complete len:86 (-) Transcript_1323:382-639(-)
MASNNVAGFEIQMNDIFAVEVGKRLGNVNSKKDDCMYVVASDSLVTNDDVQVTFPSGHNNAAIHLELRWFMISKQRHNLILIKYV